MEERMRTRKEAVPWLMGLLGMVLWFGWVESAIGGVVARIAPAGDAIELDIHTDIGVEKDVIPLYHSGEIRYFSAGIGQVEREATYPPFSLKLIFTAGGKSFVTGVAVTVRNAKGDAVLTIPAEHINGPWLFMDLPEGTYEVTGMLGGHVQAAKDISVKPGKSITRHLRWVEDRSPPSDVRPESGP
jgi:hypothetical protein